MTPDESPSIMAPLTEKNNKSSSPGTHVATRARVLRTRPPPSKHTKATLTALRSSQRASVLAKRRGTATTSLRRSTSPSADEDDATPEILRGDKGETALEITMCCPSPPPPPSPPSPPSSPPPASSPATTWPPPTPPPMSSRFPSYYRRVLCQECFYRDHDYQYHHCIDCHMHGPPANKILNLTKYAIT